MINTTNLYYMSGAKKEYIGVMLSTDNFYVVVTCEDSGDKRVTYVLCPFQSNKFGFVDLLDYELKRQGYKGVASYVADDDDLTCIVIDTDGTDLRKLVPIVDVMLGILDSNHGKDVTGDMAKAMRQFLLATRRHWMTRAKYDLLNSFINEQR